MNRPKFEVGEEVILVTKTFPEHNGERVVEAVLTRGENYTGRLTGFNVLLELDNLHTFVYLLSGKEVDPRDGLEIVWAESSLRKKHKPAEMSFSALMQSLTSHVGVQ